MINELHGDVLATVDCVIVHCVNCQGVMGAGIARQIKAEFPDAYDVYKETYDNGLLVLGSVSYAYIPPLAKAPHNVYRTGQKIIANAAGQDQTGTHVRQLDYDATRTCFFYINDAMKVFEREFGITTINFPLFGCGLAGGDWKTVAEIIEEEVNDRWTKNLYLYP